MWFNHLSLQLREFFRLIVLSDSGVYKREIDTFREEMDLSLLLPPSHPSFLHLWKTPFCRLAGLMDGVWFHKLDSISEHRIQIFLKLHSNVITPGIPGMCAHVFIMVGHRISTCIWGLESVMWFNEQLFSGSWGDRKSDWEQNLDF